ncbi:uroporphyrinogen-III C-methyltransferase [Hydrogenophaga sp. IBVHS2]|uniref:uroporphyrinogen-III C-methyltransferase n=1 Tax=Hydrogenophaga sp. IBVHS2 TaxID=1985170 RepID=UPI000A2D6CBF|nr:uroporphyrinogen-III C-methyltransferase [Hydrogenophaga sp. IBVHS2]OSZ65438.1 hypothetical protein CAP38_05010 [Hydrogenophaga sp. IBVHS2]
MSATDPTPAADMPPRPERAERPSAPQAGIGLPALALVLAVGALAFAGLQWQKLSTTQVELAERARETAEQVAKAQAQAARSDELAQELQARLTVAEVRLSEVSLQRTQLEELMLSLSRSRDDNLIQDLDSTVRLAVQQAQLTGSAQPLLTALKAADQRIARSAQPRLNPVQRAIARDIDRLQSTPLADIPTLALQLDDLSRQVDNWPLLNEVGLRRAGVSAPAAPAPAKAAATDDPEAGATPPAGWRDAVAQWWSRLWRQIGTDALDSARDLVRVTRIDHPEAALLAPEQSFFLRENIKLRLLNARLAVTARNMSAAQVDVIAIETLIERYFDAGAGPVASASTTLARLRKDLAGSPMPRPDDTLAALAVAAGGR